MTTLQDIPMVRSYADGEDPRAMIYAASCGITEEVIAAISGMEGVVCVESFVDDRDKIQKTLEEMAESLGCAIDQVLLATRIRIRADSPCRFKAHGPVIEHMLLGEPAVA